MVPRPRSLSSSETDAKVRRIKLTVAYDGHDFCGWAPQDGERTIHGTLSQAVCDLANEDADIVGASRTDSGAHAKGQVCHFDTIRPIQTSNWVRALNDLLPPDLRVIRALHVHSEFHSRFWARDRWYRYRIQTGQIDPFRTRYTHAYGRPLDAPAMHQAAQTFVGTHDFRAFTQLLGPADNTERTVHHIAVRQVRDEVWVDVLATAYARGMMRRLSGALFEVGRGSRDPATLKVLLGLQSGHRPVVLPAAGLCLMRVRHSRPTSRAG
jgi:tRNA pseudouridine38-40 synthase